MLKLLQKAKEISSLLIPGDNAKAESVNMILEYADKKERTCR
jgi:hypothetical protein